MPVMPGYTFADTPHPATVAATGYRYGYHSARTGDDMRAADGACDGCCNRGAP